MAGVVLAVLVAAPGVVEVREVEAVDAFVLDQLEQADLPLADPYSLRTPLVVGQAGDVIDPLQAKSVFFDLTTTIARPLPGQED